MDIVFKDHGGPGEGFLAPILLAIRARLLDDFRSCCTAHGSSRISFKPPSIEHEILSNDRGVERCKTGILKSSRDDTRGKGGDLSIISRIEKKITQLLTMSSPVEDRHGVVAIGMLFEVPEAKIIQWLKEMRGVRRKAPEMNAVLQAHGEYNLVPVAGHLV